MNQARQRRARVSCAKASIINVGGATHHVRATGHERRSTRASTDTRFDTRFLLDWGGPQWDVKNPNRQHWRGLEGCSGMP